MAVLTLRGIRYNERQSGQITRFVESLPGMDEDDLREATEEYIWLSGYAANNPTSAYHPMCDATYDEWVRRGDVEGYRKSHAAVMRAEGHGR